MPRYWIKVDSFTGVVDIDDRGFITPKSAPIFRKWVGHHHIDLKNWLKRIFKDVKVQAIRGK